MNNYNIDFNFRDNAFDVAYDMQLLKWDSNEHVAVKYYRQCQVKCNIAA